MPYHATQAQVSIAILTNKLQWIFRFAQIRGLRVSIQQKSEIWFGNKHQQQSNIETDQPILQRQIRQLVINVAIEHDEIDPGICAVVPRHCRD